MLVERGLATAEAIDELRREQIESAVLTMFGWPSGEFSFEMRDVGDEGAELALESGMNPQFLALEGTRRADEQGHAEDTLPPAASDPFGALLEAELVADGDNDAAEPIALLESVEPSAEPSAPRIAAEPAAQPIAGEPPAPPPVVVIDPSLPVLEWVKAAARRGLPARPRVPAPGPRHRADPPVSRARRAPAGAHRARRPGRPGDGCARRR